MQQTREDKARQARKTIKDRAQGKFRTVVRCGITVAAALMWILSMVLQPRSTEDVQDRVRMGISQASRVSPWVLTVTHGFVLNKQPIHRLFTMVVEAWRTRIRVPPITRMARFPMLCLLLLIGIGYVSCVSENVVTESQVSVQTVQNSAMVNWHRPQYYDLRGKGILSSAYEYYNDIRERY